jgi:hypothetical protein
MSLKRSIIAALLIAGLCLAIGCADKNIDAVADKGAAIPAAPPEGTDLAKAAERIPIENGPASPDRKALSQEPQERPCWAYYEGQGPGCPIDKPGFLIFVGTSSGAATADGAELNAYQNAVERLATHLQEKSGKDSPVARETARAKAYLAAGIADGSNVLRKGAWVQKWQERTQDSKRVYFRAFVLLEVSEKQTVQLAP